MDLLSGLSDHGRLAVCDVRGCSCGQGFRLRLCDWAKPLRYMGIFYSLFQNPSDVGVISKTGFSDESVRWDVPYLTSVPIAIERLSIRVDPTRKIYLFRYPRFLREMNVSVERLRLPRLGPYQTRHSGASWDQMKSHHDQLQIQKMGGMDINVLHDSLLQKSRTWSTG